MDSRELGQPDKDRESSEWKAPESQPGDFAKAPLTADTKPKDVPPSLEEATSDEDLLRFFLRYAEEYEGTEKVSQRAITEFQHFKKPPQGFEPHIYVIKDKTGNVLAGSLLGIQNSPEGKLAYFGQKVVAPEARQQNFGPQLVKRRLEAAREAGCSKAFCYVKENNSRALRSIFKDGFVVSNFPEESPTDASKPGDPWYLSRDINGPEILLPTDEEISEASDVASEEDMKTDKMLISFENKELIKLALKNNYLGRQMVLPQNFNAEDPESVKQIKMFLSK